jgi:hypothetical protein
MVKIGNQRK